MKFREPPGVQLLTADGFSRVEIVCVSDLLPLPEAVQCARRFKRCEGLFPLTSSTNHLVGRIYFCLDCVPASWV